MPRSPSAPVPAADPRASATSARILDAAESLFMEHGFEATGLRTITTAAGVNLAAANYHFGSKEALFEAVLIRRLDPMNEARVALLDALERDARGDPLSCEAIIGAMVIPALELARDRERGGKNFLRLLGRAYADPAPFIRQFLARHYAPMIARFKTAFGRTLPHLPQRELSWRLHFLMGALSYTLAGTDVLEIISALNPGATDDDELLLRRLGPFLVAGLQAPLGDLSGLPSAPRSRRVRAVERASMPTRLAEAAAPPAAAVAMTAGDHRPSRARRAGLRRPSARRHA
jgi:AcrR family transcriptional regulator